MHTGMPRVLWTRMLKCSLVAERASVATAPNKATPLPLLCGGVVERGAERGRGGSRTKKSKEIAGCHTAWHHGERLSHELAVRQRHPTVAVQGGVSLCCQLLNIGVQNV